MSLRAGTECRSSWCSARLLRRSGRARAIESNNIGAVVQERGHVTGIVTDRDLTTRLVGQGPDPRATLLAAIMSSPVVTLSPADTERDAVRLMQERTIRRIPLVEDGRLVGIVTLDDLLLNEAVSLEEVAAVTESQIGAGGGPGAIASGKTRECACAVNARSSA